MRVGPFLGSSHARRWLLLSRGAAEPVGESGLGDACAVSGKESGSLAHDFGVTCAWVSGDVAKIVADELGVPIDKVGISPADTLTTVYDVVTHATRGVYAGGGAAQKASVTGICSK